MGFGNQALSFFCLPVPQTEGRAAAGEIVNNGSWHASRERDPHPRCILLILIAPASPGLGFTFSPTSTSWRMRRSAQAFVAKPACAQGCNQRCFGQGLSFTFPGATDCVDSNFE
jgi:hypothetical protein